MKKNYTLKAMAVSAFAGLALMSCTNDLSRPGLGGVTTLSSPVSSPDVVAWSGQQTLVNSFTGYKAGYSPASRSADVNGNLWYQNWDTPQNVTPEEIQKVLEAVKDPIRKVNDIKIDWTNYWVQQVYKGVAQYTDGAGHSGITGSDKMNHLLAYNENYPYGSYWDSDLGQNVSPYYYEHINNFNYGDNQTVYTEDGNGTNPGARYIGTTLMTNMDSRNIDAQHQFAYNNSVDSKNHFEYIIVNVDGNYYVCFDFYATHPKGQEANKNMDVERDYIYNDWIVKISPAYPKGTTPDNGGNVTPPQGSEKDDDCLNCGHGVTLLPTGVWVHTSSNDTHCEEGDCATGSGDHVCHNPQPQNGDNGVGGDDNNGGNNNGGNTGNNGNTNDKYNIKHVEVNLALNDVHTLPNGSNKYDIEDLVSKLSIHVRYPKDVEVVIPVPAYIYCDQDDLYILNDHFHGNYVYGGEYQEFPIPVGDNVVTLTVEYVTAENDQLTEERQGYIRVWTTGINEEVIDYCRTNFGDGINFEVYNYYNRGNQYTTGNYAEITYDQLQWKYLSRSFINFDWQNETGSAAKTYPDYYVNAFNSVAGNYNPGDCYVWIMGDDKANNNQATYVANGSIYRGTGFSETVIWGDNSERSNFHNAYQGNHYNGSPYNWIYQLKNNYSVEPTKNAMPTQGIWPFSSSYKQDLR